MYSVELALNWKHIFLIYLICIQFVSVILRLRIIIYNIQTCNINRI